MNGYAQMCDCTHHLMPGIQVSSDLSWTLSDAVRCLSCFPMQFWLDAEHAYSNWSLHLRDGLHVSKPQNMCNLQYKKSCMWSIDTNWCIIFVLKVRLLCFDSNYFSVFECCFYFTFLSDNQHCHCTWNLLWTYT